MLAAFSTSNTPVGETVINADPKQVMDVTGNKRILADGKSVYTNFDWLIK